MIARRSRIWLVDITRGATTRATFGNTYETTPVWGPDSRTFVFAAARQAPPNLFMKRLDTQAEEKRLIDSTIQSFPQSWSKDGLIAFVLIDAKTRHDIWVVPASGEKKAWPILQTTFRETYARISPDGRWLAYVSDEGTVRRSTSPRFRRSRRNGKSRSREADGRSGGPTAMSYYRAPDGRLMAVSVAAERDFKAGLPTPLFSPLVNPGLLGLGTFYDVAADGRFLVNIFVERSVPPAAVILNWTPAHAQQTRLHPKRPFLRVRV